MMLLAPERVRCRTCRRFLGFTVIDGQFCSYECAGRTAPSDDIKTAPRQCVVPGRQRWKRRYTSSDEAEAVARDQGKQAYSCDYCGCWHIGGARRTEES